MGIKILTILINLGNFADSAIKVILSYNCYYQDQQKCKPNIKIKCALIANETTVVTISHNTAFINEQNFKQLKRKDKVNFQWKCSISYALIKL